MTSSIRISTLSMSRSFLSPHCGCFLHSTPTELSWANTYRGSPSTAVLSLKNKTNKPPNEQIHENKSLEMMLPIYFPQGQADIGGHITLSLSASNQPGCHENVSAHPQVTMALGLFGLHQLMPPEKHRVFVSRRWAI